ncbi:DedA protein [Salmonella enterica subsp. enterica]|uniref:DedA protein n=1 Tax=Salmonella enterica I TaxID=59201 RepID=A0A379WQY0_SALET|nr:DedA protein [Salmonella enterica subsp. enterica]
MCIWRAGRGVRRLGVRYFVFDSVCETGLVVTPFLPGDSLLFVAGALASLETNDLNVHVMVAVNADRRNWSAMR